MRRAGNLSEDLCLAPAGSLQTLFAESAGGAAPADARIVRYLANLGALYRSDPPLAAL